MQFLIFSDSHGNPSVMSRVLRKNPDVRNVLFLGDGLRDVETLARLHPERSIRAVRGNCDALTLEYPTEDIFSLYGTTVFLCHGHTLGVKGGLGGAIACAKEAGARVLLYGHTHTPHEEYLSESGLYLCNPGSIGQGHGGEGSFAILDLLPNGSVSISHGHISLYSCKE